MAKGWWPADRPFDFAAAYQATNWWKIAHNTGRQTLLTSLLLGRSWRDESYPFCVKAARKVSPEDVKAALCAHGDGGGKPHVDDFDRPALCRAQTVESLVCAYAKPLSETVLHVSGHHPCTSGYKAVRPLSGEPLPAAFDDGDAAARLDAHLAKSPTNGVFAAFDGFGDAPPVDLCDAVYAWGYVLDRTPTACPFVTGETDWSLERAAEFLNAKKTIYMNSMFNRGYVAKHFRSWDESCFTNVIDGRLSEAQIAKVAKSREIWCALEHDARESSADRIAKLSLKHPNVVGINLDDFNNGTPATAMTPLELKALRERVHAVNPKLKIMVVSYAHPPMRCDLTPFRGLIDVVSRWCWKPTPEYWDNYFADIETLRAEVGVLGRLSCGRREAPGRSRRRRADSARTLPRRLRDGHGQSPSAGRRAFREVRPRGARRDSEPKAGRRHRAPGRLVRESSRTHGNPQEVRLLNLNSAVHFLVRCVIFN